MHVCISLYKSIQILPNGSFKEDSIAMFCYRYLFTDIWTVIWPKLFMKFNQIYSDHSVEGSKSISVLPKGYCLVLVREMRPHKLLFIDYGSECLGLPNYQVLYNRSSAIAFYSNIIILIWNVTFSLNIIQAGHALYYLLVSFSLQGVQILVFVLVNG